MMTLEDIEYLHHNDYFIFLHKDLIVKRVTAYDTSYDIKEKESEAIKLDNGTLEYPYDLEKAKDMFNFLSDYGFILEVIINDKNGNYIKEVSF
jgi:hypothetical protein